MFNYIINIFNVNLMRKIMTKLKKAEKKKSQGQKD